MATHGSGGPGGDRGHDDKRPGAGHNESNEPGKTRLPSLSEIQQTWRTVEPNVHQQGRSTAGSQFSDRLPPIITPPSLPGLSIHESPSHFTSTTGRDVMQPEPQHLFLTPQLPVDLSPSRNTAYLGRLGPQPLITPTCQLGTDSSLAGSMPRTVSLSQPLLQPNDRPAPQASDHRTLDMVGSENSNNSMYLPPPRESPLVSPEADVLATSKYAQPPKGHVFHETLSDRGWNEPEIWRWWRNNDVIGSVLTGRSASITGDKKCDRTREEESSEVQCAWFGPLPYERKEAYLERAVALGVDDTPDSFYLHHWFEWREQNDTALRSLGHGHEASVLRRKMRKQKARSERDRKRRELEMVGAEVIDKTPPLQLPRKVMLEMTQAKEGIDAMYLPPFRSVPMPSLEIDPTQRSWLVHEEARDHPFHSELVSRGWIEPEIWRRWRVTSRYSTQSRLGNITDRVEQQELCAIQTSWFGPMPYENWKHYKDRVEAMGIDTVCNETYLRAWFDWREKNDSSLAISNSKGGVSVDDTRWKLRMAIRAKQKAKASGGVPGTDFGGEHDHLEDDDSGSGGGSGGQGPGGGAGGPIPSGSGCFLSSMM